MVEKIIPVSKVLNTFLEGLEMGANLAEPSEFERKKNLKNFNKLKKIHDTKSVNPEDKTKYQDMPPSRVGKKGELLPNKEMDELRETTPASKLLSQLVMLQANVKEKSGSFKPEVVKALDSLVDLVKQQTGSM